jgi:hypothetical protein
MPKTLGTYIGMMHQEMNMKAYMTILSPGRALASGLVLNVGLTSRVRSCVHRVPLWSS